MTYDCSITVPTVELTPTNCPVNECTTTLHKHSSNEVFHTALNLFPPVHPVSTWSELRETAQNQRSWGCPEPGNHQSSGVCEMTRQGGMPLCPAIPACQEAEAGRSNSQPVWATHWITGQASQSGLHRPCFCLSAPRDVKRNSCCFKGQCETLCVSRQTD